MIKAKKYLMTFGLCICCVMGFSSELCAYNCWCGKETSAPGATPRVYHCQPLQQSGGSHLRLDTWETDCDTACKDIFRPNEQHYWVGYGDSRTQCADHPKKANWSEPYTVTIDDNPVGYF